MAKFDVCIEIDRTGGEMLYYIYKLENGTKYWLNKKKELDRWHGAKAYVKSWERAAKIVNQIFAGEIK
jgi:hypothetical protein